MSSVLRLSILIATFVIPLRLASNPRRAVGCFAVCTVGYYGMLRTGIVNVAL